MDVMGGKITINLKELHYNRKKKKHMHAGKELQAHYVEIGRLSCDSDASNVGSARSDSTRVVKLNRRKTNRRKANRRKARPYYIHIYIYIYIYIKHRLKFNLIIKIFGLCM
jgi:hypothetical protein